LIQRLGKHSIGIHNIPSIGIDIDDNLEVQKDDIRRKNFPKSIERKAFPTCWTSIWSVLPPPRDTLYIIGCPLPGDTESL
jgi:hypothetical protein